MHVEAVEVDPVARYDQALEEILLLRAQSSDSSRMNPIDLPQQFLSKKAVILETEAMVSSLLGEIDSHLSIISDSPVRRVEDISPGRELPRQELNLPSLESPKKSLMNVLKGQLGDTWLSYIAYSSPGKLLDKYSAAELNETFQAVLERFKHPLLMNLFDDQPLIQDWLSNHTSLTDASEIASFITSTLSPCEAIEALQLITQVFLEEQPQCALNS